VQLDGLDSCFHIREQPFCFEKLCDSFGRFLPIVTTTPFGGPSAKAAYQSLGEQWQLTDL
jgi:hypothetical protein